MSYIAVKAWHNLTESVDFNARNVVKPFSTLSIIWKARRSVKTRICNTTDNKISVKTKLKFINLGCMDVYILVMS